MNIKLASIVAQSREEYPPYLTDVVYLGGCPLRCGFCYVPELLHTKTCGEKSVQELAAYFSRKGVQAVSLKGGEPLSQANALLELCQRVKAKGIKTKIETAGFFPEGFYALLPWLDYACVDVKTALDAEAYGEMTGSKGDVALMQILKTLAFLEATPYPVFKEIRVTIVPTKNDSSDAAENIASYVRKFCDLFVLQQFNPHYKLVDPAYEKLPETPKEKLAELAMIARNLIPNVAIRTTQGVQFIQ